MSDFVDLELESPFQPSTPVKPEFFKGRREIIKKILRYLNKSMKCDVQHFFLTGNRGMGKTSIAEFIMEEIKEFNILSVYVSNKNNNSVDSLVSNVMKALVNKLPPKSRSQKVKTWFGDHVSEINIQGTKLKFNLDKTKEEDIKNNFLDYLTMSYTDLKDSYNAMFIIIDDINGLSESREFVDWYKQFADTVAVDDSYNIPLYFLLEGYQDKFDNLVELEPSFGRIFHYADVDLLEDDEIKSFFNDTFTSLNITIDEDALNFMTEYTSGIPLTMQFIGDAVFWNLNENKISIAYAKEGTIIAARNMENNQIRRTLKQINNKLYENILIKIASNNLTSFRQENLHEILSEKEVDDIDAFLEKVKQLNIIQKDDYSDRYVFEDMIFYTYYHIKAFERKYN